MGVLSTFMISPIFKQLANMIDCNHTETGQAYVATAPDVVCFQGAHLVIFCLVWSIGVAYFYTVVILTAIEGNINELEAEMWCSPSRLLEARKRRAEIYNLGPLAPNGDSM